MALIARIQHPYIVEFKEAWVEKVGPGNSSFLTNFFAANATLYWIESFGLECRVAMFALSLDIVKEETCEFAVKRKKKKKQIKSLKLHLHDYNPKH